MREPQCTPEVTAAVVKAIKDGLTIKSSMALAGFAVSTYGKWKRRGEAGEEPYVAFVAAITRAREEAKREAVSDIKHAVVRTKEGDIPDWRARAWWLARAFPEEFTERVDVHVRDEATEYVFARLREKLDDATFERVMGCFDPEDASEVSEAETQH